MVKCQNFIKIGRKLRITCTFEFWITFLRSQNISQKRTKLGPIKLKSIQFSQAQWLFSD
jgi:hypothetical protein